MSVGHWIVIVMDVLFTVLAVGGTISMLRHRDEGVEISIGIIILMLFNIAAITVR